MNVEVNYLAVVLAAIIAMVIGFLWYSPLILGKPWMRLHGYDKKNKDEMKKAQKEMTKWYVVVMVLTIVSAYVLSHVTTFSQSYFDYPRLTSGLTSAFWMWLGFVMPTQAGAQIFGPKKWQVFGIDTSYQLVSLLAMGAVIGAM